MKLAVLLHEIEKSPGPVTGLDLAKRLDLTPAEVMAMISALRAAGKLTPEGPMAEEHCPTAASCSLSCPGPDKCALAVNFTISGLEIRSSRASTS